MEHSCACTTGMQMTGVMADVATCAGLPRPASDESLDGRGASDNSLVHINSSKGDAPRI